MNASKLKGKVIRRVYQIRSQSDYKRVSWVLQAIEFTDGTVLRFHPIETSGEPEVQAVYPGREIE